MFEPASMSKAIIGSTIVLAKIANKFFNKSKQLKIRVLNVIYAENGIAMNASSLTKIILVNSGWLKRNRSLMQN